MPRWNSTALRTQLIQSAKKENPFPSVLDFLSGVCTFTADDFSFELFWKLLKTFRETVKTVDSPAHHPQKASSTTNQSSAFLSCLTASFSLRESNCLNPRPGVPMSLLYSLVLSHFHHFFDYLVYLVLGLFNYQPDSPPCVTSVHCIVLGDKKSGKSHFLDELIEQTQLVDSIISPPPVDDVFRLESKRVSLSLSFSEFPASARYFHNISTSCHPLVVFYLIDLTSKNFASEIQLFKSIRPRMEKLKITVILLFTKLDLLQFPVSITTTPVGSLADLRTSLNKDIVDANVADEFFFIEDLSVPVKGDGGNGGQLVKRTILCDIVNSLLFVNRIKAFT
jgi:hypothetical protein